MNGKNLHTGIDKNDIHQDPSQQTQEAGVFKKATKGIRAAIVAACAAGNLVACDAPNTIPATVANPTPVASATAKPTENTEKKESTESLEKQHLNTLYSALTGQKSRIPRVGEKIAQDNTAYMAVLPNGNMVIAMDNATFAAEGINVKEIQSSTDAVAPTDATINEFLEQLAQDADRNTFGSTEFQGRKYLVAPKGFSITENHGDREIYNDKQEHVASVNYSVESNLRNDGSKVIFKVTPKMYLSHGFPITINGEEKRISGTKDQTTTYAKEAKGNTQISYSASFDAYNPNTKQFFSADGKRADGEATAHTSETVPSVSWSSVANELDKRK